MCNRYVSPEQAEVERFWGLTNRQAERLWLSQLTVYPRAAGAFIRQSSNGVGRELVLGQWGLVPKHSPTNPPRTRDGKPMNTNNARAEDVAWKHSYKDAWARGQRCIIPAAVFFEPNWETLRNVWWGFRRADGQPWGLAGIWETWTHPETGELVESYSMLTTNADADPLMSRMHRPDPKLALDKQDKRRVISLDPADFDVWLQGAVDQAKGLMKPAPVEVFDAEPMEPEQKTLL